MTIRKAIVIVCKVGGLASITGSSYIIHSLVGNATARREKMNTTFHRFLLVLSIFDIFSSFAYFLSTWAVPEEPPEGLEDAVDPSIFDYHHQFPWAAGTRTSCRMQGFLIQLGIAGSVLFTGFTSLQFVLSVRYNWSEVSMRRLEKVCFAIGILYPLVSATFFLVTKKFNVTSSGVCWVYQYPIVCQDLFYEQDPSIETWCNSNPEFNEFDEASAEKSQRIGFLIVGATFLVVVVSMILLFLAVREQEQRTRRWSVNSQRGKHSKKVIRKAMLFIGNYLIMYVPVIAVLTKPNGSGDLGDLIASLTLPIQGFLNALVYSGMAERLLCCKFCGHGQENPPKPPQFSSMTASMSCQPIGSSVVEVLEVRQCPDEESFAVPNVTTGMSGLPIGSSALEVLEERQYPEEEAPAVSNETASTSGLPTGSSVLEERQCPEEETPDEKSQAAR